MKYRLSEKIDHKKRSVTKLHKTYEEGIHEGSCWKY